jgi:hypothetical protein
MHNKVKAAGLLTAGLVSGGILFGTFSANAADTSAPAGATSSTATATSQVTPGTPPSSGSISVSPEAVRANPPQGAPGDGHGIPGRPANGEKALTGTDLAKATAAAKAAVPGATIVRAETDSGDAKYEVHVTVNGTPKTVKLNADFTLKAVEDGMGK